MGKFRKKPIVIEAEQYIELGFAPEILIKIDEDRRELVSAHWEATKADSPRLMIDTLEGKMRVSLGDWIIRGVNGEFYPCKPDIFEKTYDPVESEEGTS